MTFAEVWQWINDNLTTIEKFFIPLVIAIVYGLWVAFTYFHKNGKQTKFQDVDKQNNSAQIHNGDNVAGDKIRGGPSFSTTLQPC